MVHWPMSFSSGIRYSFVVQLPARHRARREAPPWGTAWLWQGASPSAAHRLPPVGGDDDYAHSIPQSLPTSKSASAFQAASVIPVRVVAVLHHDVTTASGEPCVVHLERVVPTTPLTTAITLLPHLLVFAFPALVVVPRRHLIRLLMLAVERSAINVGWHLQVLNPTA